MVEYNLKTSILWKAFIFSLLINTFFFNVTHVISIENNTSVLIVYSNNEEEINIRKHLPNQINNLIIDSTKFNQLSDYNLSDYDMLILSSSTEFIISKAEKNKILSFGNDPSKVILTFTPFIDLLEDDIENLLGIKDTEDIKPDDHGNITWGISLLKKIGQYSINDTFEYIGKIGMVKPMISSNVIASIISSNSSNPTITQLDYPIPIVINATQDDSAVILTSLLSPVIYTQYDKDENGLQLNQIPSFFDSLIKEIIQSAFTSYHIKQISISNSKASQSSNNPTTGKPGNNNGNNFLPLNNLPSNNLLKLLILFLIGLIFLFIGKIVSIMRWLTEKMFGAAILVIGAFYNIQDRILDYNDVIINQSRADIVDYLEYIGKHGAHLREIKSMLKMGTGSLLWHLQVLEDFGWISKYKISNYVVFVADDFVDQFDHELKHLELALQSKYTLDIIESLINSQEDNLIDITTIENITGINRKAIRRLIKKMYNYNLIDVINEKPIQIKITDKSKLKTIHNSMWKRLQYTQSQSTISVDAVAT